MTGNLRIAEGAGQQGASAVMLSPSLPLSFAQQRLWLLCQSQSALNMQGLFRLEGSLRVEFLQQAFSKLLQRHEMLRARIRMTDDNSGQVIGDAGDLRIDVLDLSSLDETLRIARPAAVAQSDRAYQFDLANGPLLRASLLCMGDHAYYLI